MRRIKIGDRVKAFLDANIAGEVVNIVSRPVSHWMVGGTSSVEFWVDVRLANGTVRNIKLSELTHDDL